jgi:hypothetical protein
MPTADAAELTARAIIDANLYMVLATADDTGRPWSSPVYFAHEGCGEFLWAPGGDCEGDLARCSVVASGPIRHVGVDVPDQRGRVFLVAVPSRPGER